MALAAKSSVRSASFRPDGSGTVTYQNGKKSRLPKFPYLKDTVLSERELRLWN